MRCRRALCCALLRLSRRVLVQVAGLAVGVVVRKLPFHLQLPAARTARGEANRTSSPAGDSEEGTLPSALYTIIVLKLRDLLFFKISFEFCYSSSFLFF